MHRKMKTRHNKTGGNTMNRIAIFSFAIAAGFALPVMAQGTPGTPGGGAGLVGPGAGCQATWRYMPNVWSNGPIFEYRVFDLRTVGSGNVRAWGPFVERNTPSNENCLNAANARTDLDQCTGQVQRCDGPTNGN